MLKDLVKQNRSYRSFDGSFEITRETLLDLVDCARFTPSSINMQPFQYFLSYKPETNDIIYPLTAWARLLPGFEGPAEGHRPTAYIIVSKESDAIAKRVMDELERGVTGLKGRGMYSGAEREVLLCVVSRIENIHLRRIVAECDPRAFMIAVSAGEVLGEGFKDIKIDKK